MDQLRQSILQQTQTTATKRRFGLFGQPPPLSIGDDSPYKTMLRTYSCKFITKNIDPRDQAGKPKTEPRQFATSATKTGKVSSSYFAVPDSIYQGDPYVDDFKRRLVDENTRYKKGKIHETDFKPASGSKSIATPSYKHADEKPLEKKRPARDDAGRVVTQARNVLTNSCRKVEDKLLKTPPYISDQYSRKWDVERQRHKEEMKKRGEAPFRSMSSGPALFNKHLKVYGTDANFAERKRTTSTYDSNSMKHQAVFKPSNISRSTIGKYPAHMPENPLPKPPQRKTVEGEKIEVFKPQKPALSRPTPSITLHPTNIRRSLKA